MSILLVVDGVDAGRSEQRAVLIGSRRKSVVVGVTEAATSVSHVLVTVLTNDDRADELVARQTQHFDAIFDHFAQLLRHTGALARFVLLAVKIRLNNRTKHDIHVGPI